VNVICGVNGESWQEAELFLCHHCGMPVCARDGVTIAADDAFDVSQEPVSRAAMHCPSCADEYHRGAARYHGWTDPKRVQVAIRGSQPVPTGGAAPYRPPARQGEVQQGQQVRARAVGGQ
jgi:hypothetical protein